MKKNEEKIIKLMLSLPNQWVTSKELSLEAGFSVRSVKTYIKGINDSFPEAIYASNKGYKLNLNVASKIANRSKYNIVEAQEDRVALLVKQLIDAAQPLDIYEVSNFFYISETTLRSDIQVAKSLASKHDLRIVSKKSTIFLDGAERNKRRLLHDLLNSETADTIFNAANLQSMYGSTNTETIKEIVINTFFKYEYFTNDYLLNNIVLHIAIALERIKLQIFLSSTTEQAAITDQKVFTVAQDIARRIEEKYRVIYQSSEIVDLSILIASSINSVNFMHLDIADVDHIVGDETSSLVEKIINDVQTNYYIHLDDPNFRVRFSLHIKNLLIRLKSGISVKNMLTKTIKKECPLIYDCAVNASSIIEKELDFQLSDDEIAYLSFHLGYALETYTELNKKIDCILLSPIYYNMNAEILHKLQTNFGDEINIKNIITNEKDLPKVEGEFVISITKLANLPKIPCVTITPFIGKRDKELILSFIQEIKQQQKTHSFKDSLQEITFKELYVHDTTITTRSTALEKLCGLMTTHRFCDESYLQAVNDRERLSSTAFGKIAIPHSIKMIGKKTAMGILINPNGIEWDKENKVYVVLLLCIHPDDKQIYHEVFDEIADILTMDSAIQQLAASKDYQSFLKTSEQLL